MSKENKQILRAYFDKETEKRFISGYAIVFNQLSKRILENGKLFYEKILDTALQNTDMSNVLMLVDHNKDKLLARSKSETLTFEIDSYGVYYTFEVPETELGNSIYKHVERGDYTENSFAYILDEKNKEDVEYIKDKEYDLIRVVKNIRKITDFSIVINGAYSQTYIFLERNLDDIEKELEQSDKEQTNNLELYNKKLQLLKIK
ncbi:MAG: HK97 family phage prohead protease [bacterium]